MEGVFRNLQFAQYVLSQQGPVSCHTSLVLTAILVFSTVQGDKEQWFWGLVRAQKVEQLNAAFSLPLWLLHIQQVTHFFPSGLRCLTPAGVFCQKVTFLGEEKETIIPLPHS